VLQAQIFDTCDSNAVPLLDDSVRIALYQPEIAGNVGAILRLAACMDVPVEIIEPTGFVFSDARMKRAAMDYAEQVTVTRHQNWDAFLAKTPGRLILLTTRGTSSLYATRFECDDTLLFGRESSGVPQDVAAACALHVRIPLAPAARSLNLSVSAGIAISEALRQTGGLPE